jgi:hypothetical protein
VALVIGDDETKRAGLGRERFAVGGVGEKHFFLSVIAGSSSDRANTARRRRKP